MSLRISVVIITKNEEASLPRTLESVKPLVADGQGEIIVVDSGSTDKTVEIAKSFGAKVFVEEWKGFAAQKNSAIEKAQGEWVLSLDADEEVSAALAQELFQLFAGLDESRAHAQSFFSSVPPKLREKMESGTELTAEETEEIQRLHKAVESGHGHVLHKYFGWRHFLEMRRLARRFEAETGTVRGEGFGVALAGFQVPRQNEFLGRWVRHGGFWPDYKLRLFMKGAGHVPERPVHEIVEIAGFSLRLKNPLIHHSYPTLEIYLEHMRRYADLGAEMIKGKPRWWLWLNRWFNPPLTFFYNYVVRLGFLDGREGFLLHWNHRRYVGWKYEKALELQERPATDQRG